MSQSNFVIGDLKEDEEDLYHLVVYQIYPQAWPGSLESDGYIWEYKGNGFLDAQECSRFEAKAIYKLMVEEKEEEEEEEEEKENIIEV